MKLKNYVFAILSFWVLTIWTGPVKAQKSKQSMDEFVGHLMLKMTVDEKIGQLNLSGAGYVVAGQVMNSDIAKSICKGQVGGILSLKGLNNIRELQTVAVKKSRLGIPILFGLDVIHGYETTFPIPLAMSCSWDMDAIEKAARIAAIEASANGICWTFSPMVDICHDGRWGRIAEGAGEDPFLGAAVATAMVKGYQEDFSSSTDILACVKHFALYGAAEAGRDYNSVDMSTTRMFNEYLPPYKAALDAGAGSVMTSFNTINGIPATANKWLLTDLLRNQWNFKGFVVTDATAIAELINHGLGSNMQEVSALALNAGVDMDMGSQGFVNTLKQSLNQGKINDDEINNACRHILEAKYKLGLFDNPYKYCDVNRSLKDTGTPEHRASARKLATESFVLLKNENNLLPLQRKGTIAVIGPLADASNNMVGTWSVSKNGKSLIEGLKQTAGNDVKIIYARGCNLTNDEKFQERETIGSPLYRDNRSKEEMLKEALEVAGKSDIIIAALGESAGMSGESSSRSDLCMLDAQKELLEALSRTGKPIVLVLFNGRPLVLKWEKENIPAILDVWFGGSEAALAIGDVLFGDANPSGKLTASFPQNVGQLPYSYNHLNTGRPLDKGQWFRKFHSEYLDVSNDMLFPFGYGLSYTRYQYSDMRLSSSALNAEGSIMASITVTNTGKRDGDEIVQMYLQDVVGSISRPVKELKGFKRIHLKAGESKLVNFTITTDLLKFYNDKLQYIAEPGEFRVMIGPDSEDCQSQSFKLE